MHFNVRPPHDTLIAKAHDCTASLVALLAHSRKVDRAVMNSLRNFLRTMGGTLGLTGMILASELPEYSYLRLDHIFLIAVTQRVGTSSQHPLRINLF